MPKYYFYFDGGVETCIEAESVEAAFAYIKEQAATVPTEQFDHYNLAKLYTFSEDVEKFVWSEIFQVWKDKPDNNDFMIKPFPDIEEYLEEIKQLIPYLIPIASGYAEEVAYFYATNILQRLLILNKIKSIVFIPHLETLLIDDMPFPLESDAFMQYPKMIQQDDFDLWPETTLSLTIVPEDPKMTWVFFREEMDLFSPPKLILRRNYVLNGDIIWETTEINGVILPPSENETAQHDRIRESNSNVIIKRHYRAFNAHPNYVDIGAMFPSQRKKPTK